jgi:sugar lactone lactonase YvrE
MLHQTCQKTFSPSERDLEKHPAGLKQSSCCIGLISTITASISSVQRRVPIRTFYPTDSFPKTIDAYDFNLAEGSLTERRVWVDLSEEAFEPDGLTVDREGCIWSAMWNGWCIIRFDPDGKEMMRVKLPIQRPTACAFGGVDRTTLYITTASIGLSEVEIEGSFQSDDLFSLQTHTIGLPAHPFGPR